MKNLILVVLLVSVCWYGYTQYQQHQVAALEAATPVAAPAATPATSPFASETQFKCDGRIYCSQMRSCAEATYFLQHCPGTKMDGDNDGIPCESQWCK